MLLSSTPTHPTRSMLPIVTRTGGVYIPLKYREELTEKQLTKLAYWNLVRLGHSIRAEIKAARKVTLDQF